MVVGTRGSSSSEPEGRLRDLGLPPVFNGEGDSHIAFRRWCDQVETYLELKGIAHVLHEPEAATDAERHYVSAVLTRTLDGAAYNVALSSGKRQPDLVWEKLKDRYDASRQVSVNSVWRKINRRQMGINDTPRSLINWLEQQFTEIAFISGEQPTEEEKCRSLWQILEEREEYTSMLFQSSRGGEATWTQLCKDLEDLNRLRQLRSVNYAGPVTSSTNL